MRKAVFFICLFFVCSAASAQLLTAEQYIDVYKDIAIREMKRMGIPASITLAQGILETESGNSDLVKKSNNHFGIKCKSSWSGSSVSHDDDASGECFRKYNTAEDSYRDHSNFLRGSDRYAFLFKLPASDYKGWAHGLKKAGYATNPAYPDILIKNIEKYNLQQYTLIGVGEVPVFDDSKYTDDKPEAATGRMEENELSTGSPVSSAMVNRKSMFNGLKAVNAAAGTSLLAIATEYKIDLVKLLEFNELKEDGLLKEDGWIFLEKKSVNGNRDFYVTEKEESINSIAQANGIQVSYLLQYNNLEDGAIIKPKTKVFLRGVTDQKAMADNSTMKVHEVQPKEGLYAISKKYNVSVQDLRAWNALVSDDLKIGQKLIISK
ncbi:MAG: glucosaminidase domain-containing protein [Ferruginibacter sp.]|nr:glucosaminidase domain-containing protein [Ferruginibacter sp.]